MMKKLILIVLCLWVGSAYCDGVGESLQIKLNSVHTMSASFTQVVFAKKREISRTSGTMALSRPGRFRWQTVHPMEQLLIADGKQMWVYDVELEQVTVKKQEKGLSGAAGLFLSGYSDTVTRDFEVTTHHTGAKTYFDLKSKSSKANFQRVILAFEGDKLCQIELFDQLGQHTDVTLRHVINNESLKSSLFTFKIPKGVDVVSQ